MLQDSFSTAVPRHPDALMLTALAASTAAHRWATSAAPISQAELLLHCHHGDRIGRQVDHGGFFGFAGLA